jgi:hypothetical protein
MLLSKNIVPDVIVAIALTPSMSANTRYQQVTSRGLS